MCAFISRISSSPYLILFVQFKKKTIDFIKQSRHWSEDLERDDIREESKKGLEQVEKFTARGLEKATDEKKKVVPLTTKHEVAKDREKGRPFPVSYLGKEYQVQFTYEYDPNAAELYDIQVSSDKKKIDIKTNEVIIIFLKMIILKICKDLIGPLI